MRKIPTEQMVYEYLKDNGVFADVYIDVDNDCGVRICVEISYGDWKHDHWRADYLMKEKFNPNFAFEDIIDQNGSDTYSAIHRYIFTKN